MGTQATDIVEYDAATLMLKAADEMEKRGYNNYTRLAGDGSVCVLGAIEFALGCEGMVDESWAPLEEIRRKLGLPVHASTCDPAAWALATWSNALDGPTVIAALREAASREVTD